jgi:hypothetical protein
MPTQDRDPLLRAFYNNQVHCYDIVPKISSSTFGGPLETSLYGNFPQAALLHQIAFICGTDRPDYETQYLRDLPLLFGMLFDGCALTYQLVSGEMENEGHRFHYSGIEILEMDKEEPTEDWPYADYPRHLPYWPIAKISQEPCTWQEFGESIFDYRENQEAPLVFALSPPMTAGFSLWGRSGDAEQVQIIWEIDPATEIIKARTRCG